MLKYHYSAYTYRATRLALVPVDGCGEVSRVAGSAGKWGGKGQTTTANLINTAKERKALLDTIKYNKNMQQDKDHALCSEH